RRRILRLGILLLLWCRLLLLFGPFVGLASGDAIRHGGGRTRDYWRPGDTSHESWHCSVLSRVRIAGSAGFGCVERGQYIALRDVAGGRQFGATPAHALAELPRPAVLEDEDRRRRPGLDHVLGVVEVRLVEHPGRRTLEDGHVELAVTVEIA